jgi:glutaredoxin-like protein NrdH
MTTSVYPKGGNMAQCEEQPKEQAENKAQDQPKVFLYALSTCGHCRSAKKLLDAKDVEYDFVDVDLLPRDELKTTLDEVRKVNPQAAFPTILIGDKVIVGYRESDILEALGL